MLRQLAETKLWAAIFLPSIIIFKDIFLLVKPHRNLAWGQKILSHRLEKKTLQNDEQGDKQTRKRSRIPS